MLAAVTGAVAKKAGDLVFTLVQKKIELWKGFEDDVEDIKADLEMIVAAEEDLILQKGDVSKVKIQSMEEMRGLAQKIEDSLDEILCYAKSKPLHRFKKVSSHMGSPPFADMVKKLKKQLKAAKQRALDFNVNGSQTSTMARQPVDDYSSRCPGIRKPVGINKPKEEILELLSEIKGQPEQLAVICIVGFGGSGKSTLADAVYQDEKIRRPSSYWIDARQHKDDIKGLRKSIADHIVLHQEMERYLIVLDNIEDQQWHSISSTFSENSTGIIIVTTSAQSVANQCSSHGNGHVYKIRTLEDGHSEEFLKSVLESRKNLSLFEDSLKLIVKKCDGHPLALDSMARYLLRKPQFTKEDFCNFWGSLGDKMKEFEEFTNLEQILMKNYCRLPGFPDNFRACLLYICAFPDGHPIRRNRLIRRWLAEGYSQQKANESFEKLVDQNIFRIIESSKSKEVKTCIAHGIIHGFMMHMSKSTRFMESANNSERRKYRHLYRNDGELTVCQSHNSEESGAQKFHAHSLTICGRAGKKVIGDLPKCTVLRVLDLEECDDLESDDIKDINKLWHLKYLSLGPNIDKLPEKIDMLHCLETLDLRKTKIDTIPVAVIKLHHLAHLLGKFKIEKRDWEKRRVHTFFEKESNLETLAGFITDSNPGFPMIMAHMKKLNKVKIWCDSVGKDSVGFNALSEAIKMFVEARLSICSGDHSLSLYLGESSKDIISYVWPDGQIVNGYLSSLKLDGALSGLTKFARLLCGLKELCLSSTNGLTNNELTNLHMLTMLKYLKLVNVHLAGFEIKRGHFPQLLRLCLVQCHGSVPTIGEEALPYLDSLWILDEELADGLSDINIKQHKHLQEIALDTNVKPETITSWDKAAKKHPKRPKVLFFECVRSNGTGSMVKYVATKRPVPRRPGKRPDRSAESNSVVQELSSDFNKRLRCGDDANLEEALDRPPASTELCDSMDTGMASSSRLMN